MKKDTRARIIEVTAALLEQSDHPESITIRQIAEHANIGVGLINYHFQSRDHLIRLAVEKSMTQLAGTLQREGGQSDDPVIYLQDRLIQMSDIAIKNRKLSQISVEYDLLKGQFETCLYLIPALKAIFKDSKSELELRLIAFQIIVVTQSIYLRQEAFHLLTGIDIESKPERDRLIAQLVEQYIH